jgi:hypothetical protein
MHHRDTEARRFDKLGIGTWAWIGSSMCRLLAEGMVTDTFAPKARVIAEPLDCKTPNTPSCLCVFGESFLCSLAFERPRAFGERLVASDFRADRSSKPAHRKTGRLGDATLCVPTKADHRTWVNWGPLLIAARKGYLRRAPHCRKLLSLTHDRNFFGPTTSRIAGSCGPVFA